MKNNPYLHNHSHGLLLTPRTFSGPHF
jgi:hypothetical protein